MVYLNMTTSPANAIYTINRLTMIGSTGVTLFSLSILGAIWFIVFSRSRDRGVRESIASACMVTLFVGIAFTILGLTDSFTLGVLIVMAIASRIPQTSR